MKLKMKVLIRLETARGQQLFPAPSKFSYDDYATITSDTITFNEKHEMLAGIRQMMEAVLFITENIRRLF